MASDVPKLGELVVGEAFRDAIHVAVVPMTAPCRLDPGQPVRVRNGEIVTDCKIGGLGDYAATGIVDPYLPRFVETGQRFWLLLMPGSITSLRHNWTHPAFPAMSRENGTSPMEDVVAASRAWLHGWCRNYGWDFDDLIAIASESWSKGDFSVGPYESDRAAIKAEFAGLAMHLRDIGIVVQTPDADTYFRCAC